MSDDYLWTGAGTPEPRDREQNDVVKLERMLGQLRAPLPPVPAVSPAVRSTRALVGFWAPALAMAAAIVLMIASTYRGRSEENGPARAPGISWEVAQMDGRPQIVSASDSTT